MQRMQADCQVYKYIMYASIIFYRGKIIYCSRFIRDKTNFANIFLVPETIPES